MGSGDLNAKKSWFPALLTNQKRVWEAEKEASDEKKKLQQLRKEREEEAQLAELQRMQETATGKKRVEKLDWMYSAPNADSNAMGGRMTEHELEQYLLGKRRVDEVLAAGDKNVGNLHKEFIAVQNANTVRDTAAKVREDPMLAMKKAEQAQLAALMNRPDIRKQLRDLKKTPEEKEDKEERRARKRAEKDERRRERHDRRERRARDDSRSPRPDERRERHDRGERSERSEREYKPHRDDRERQPHGRDPHNVDPRHARDSRDRNDDREGRIRRDRSMSPRRDRERAERERDERGSGSASGSSGSRRDDKRYCDDDAGPRNGNSREHDDRRRDNRDRDEPRRLNGADGRTDRGDRDRGGDYRRERNDRPPPPHRPYQASRPAPPPPAAATNALDEQRAARLAAMSASADALQSDRQSHLARRAAEERKVLEAETKARSKYHKEEVAGMFTKHQEQMGGHIGLAESLQRRGGQGLLRDI